MFDKRVKSYILTDNIPASILTGPRLIRNDPVPDRAKKAVAKKMCAKKDAEEAEVFKVSILILIIYSLFYY
jgi:hypothetical protein